MKTLYLFKIPKSQIFHPVKFFFLKKSKFQHYLSACMPASQLAKRPGSASAVTQFFHTTDVTVVYFMKLLY